MFWLYNRCLFFFWISTMGASLYKLIQKVWININTIALLYTTELNYTNWNGLYKWCSLYLCSLPYLTLVHSQENYFIPYHSWFKRKLWAKHNKKKKKKSCPESETLKWFCVIWNFLFVYSLSNQTDISKFRKKLNNRESKEPGDDELTIGGAFGSGGGAEAKTGRSRIDNWGE